MFQIIEEMGPIDDDSTNVFQCLFEDEATHAPEGRVLYLSRHGESEYNLYGKIGVSDIYLTFAISTNSKLLC